MELTAGTRLNHFEVRSMISKGGMGEVYLCADLTLGRTVAVKVLRGDVPAGPDRLQRFKREALTVSRLNHPNILTIFEVGAEDGINYIASEFVAGQSLRQLLNRGPIPLQRVLDIAVQAASALSAAHAAGIIHRDIKPENIMLREDGLVKVLDFGIAKWAHPLACPSRTAATVTAVQSTAGTVVGTCGYMSPEQARGAELDERTDIFSLGVVIYELLSGTRPFDGPTVSAILIALLTSDPPPLPDVAPPLSRELDRIVTKMLAKDKQHRYRQMQDVETDLRTLTRQIDDGAGSPQKRALGNRTPSPGLNIRKPSLFLIAGAVALCAITALAGLLWWRARPITSIAVLPFVNATGNPNMEYLSDGISEGLIDTLSALPQLKVIARNSAFKFKGTDADTKVIGKTLGAQAILTGRVGLRANTMEVSVDLMDARDDTEVWGDHYARQSTDLQAIQEAIALSVSEKLRLRVSGNQRQELAKHSTKNAEAYDLYLNGIFYSSNGSWSGNKQSLEYFRQATALDADFALAYVAESTAYLNLATAVVPGLDSRDAVRNARLAAKRAVSANPALWAAHMALGQVSLVQWEWSSAEAELRRAIELNPSSSAAHGSFGTYLADVGDCAQALAENRRAQELDALNISVRAYEGFMLMSCRRFDEAITRLRSLLEEYPKSTFAHEYLALSYAAKGQYAEAIAEYQTFIRLDQAYPFIQALLAHAYARSGDRRQALAIVKSLDAASAYVSPAALSTAYIALGDNDRALTLLERAQSEHDVIMRHVNTVWIWDPIRSEPRFQRVLERMHFPHHS